MSQESAASITEKKTQCFKVKMFNTITCTGNSVSTNYNFTA